MQLMKTCFCCLLFCFILQYTYAQQTKLNWLTTATGYLNGGYISVEGIAEYADKSVIVVGYFEETSDFDTGPDTFNLKAVSTQDIFIAKYSSTGKLLFAYNFGGAGNLLNESANAVVLDKQGNAYITGTFGKDIDFDPGVGKTILSAPFSNEVFLLSLTSDGKFRYASSIAENNQNNQIRQVGKSIALDDEGNILVTGIFSGKNIDFDPGPNKALYNSQGYDIFLAKYDKTGKYIFNKTIGGDDVDDVNKLQLDNDNNVLICGYFKSYYNDFDPGLDSAGLMLHGRQDIFFAKYDKNGNYVFAKSIGGTRSDEAISLAVATDNSFIVTGTFETKNVDFDPGVAVHELSADYNGDLFFARYDKNGKYLYAYNLGTTSSDHVYDIAITKDNNFSIVGGPFSSTLDFDPAPDSTFYATGYGNQFLANYSLNGDFISAKTSASYEVNTSRLLINDDGDYLLAGACREKLDTLIANDSTNAGYTTKSHNLFVSRLDKKGKYITSFASNGYRDYRGASAGVTSFATDEYGNIYTCGGINGRIDFDPGPGLYLLDPATEVPYTYSGYIAKYDKNGKLLFAKLLPSTGGIKDIAIDKHHNIYLTGTVWGKNDFDPSDSVYTLSFEYYGYFIAKYDSNGNFVFAEGEDISYDYSNGFNFIEIDASGNIRIGGHFNRTIDFDPSPATRKINATGYYDAFFATYTPGGKLMDVKHLGGAGSSCTTSGFKLLSDNSCVLTGVIYGETVDFDPNAGTKILPESETSGFIATYSARGELQLVFGFNGISRDFNQETAVLEVDSLDNIYVSGRFTGTLDFDPGIDTFALNNNSIDNFFASYDRHGNFRYARNFKKINSATYDHVSALGTDKFNNIYVAMSFTSQAININTGGQPVIIKNEDYTDYNTTNSKMFIAVYDSAGNYLTHYPFKEDSAAGSNTIRQMFISGDRLIVSAYLQSKIDIDLSKDTTYFIPGNGSDFCLASYTLALPYQQKIPIAQLNNKYFINEKYKSFIKNE